MRRRQFITLLVGATAAWPLAARAQQTERIRRIGFLHGLAESDPEAQARISAFREGLAALGWIEGRNISIDYRFAGGDPARAQAIVAELVGSVPDLIVGNSTPIVAELKKATNSIPVVFAVLNDPVGQGLIASLARPSSKSSRASRSSSSRSSGGGWNCSKRWHPACIGSRSCSTRRPRLIMQSSCVRSRLFHDRSPSNSPQPRFGTRPRSKRPSPRSRASQTAA